MARFDERVAAASVSSALWAAWADALGFISELTTVKGVFRRLKFAPPPWEGPQSDHVHRLLDAPPEQWPLRHTVAWTRRIGGQGGPNVALPAGTYSDDTQLRLATSRCIHEGGFDPERFAAIELPAFTSYGLGGGKATRDGAAAMAKAHTAWPAPGHQGWARAGGNGVVMRVAPLAYAAAAAGRSEAELALDVIRNGIVTHGHPRALLPACLHAMALLDSLRRRHMVPLTSLHGMVEWLTRVPELMAADPVLGPVTLTELEQQTRANFSDIWRSTAQELHGLIDLYSATGRPSPSKLGHTYLGLAMTSGLFAKETLGVGTGCFVAAYWIADQFRDDPLTGLLLAANAVGTDTDTIATIAGAHLGVTVPFFGGSPLLDDTYIEEETLRLVHPDHPRAAADMRYPGLDEWRAPTVQADYLGIDPSSGRVAVAGLGAGEWMSTPFPSRRTPEFAWQWMRLDYGQTLLVKRRRDLQRLSPTQLAPISTHGRAGEPTVPASDELDELRARVARANAASANKRRDESGRTNSGAPPSDTAGEPRAFDVESALAYTQEREFSDDVVGRMLRFLTTRIGHQAAEEYLRSVSSHWLSDRPK